MVPMAKDNQIAVRVNDPTYEAIKEYADEYDLTRAEAVRRMSERVLTGEGYLSGPARADGGQVIERLDEIEQSHQEEFNRIESTIDTLQEEPSFFEQLLDRTTWVFWALTLAGSVVTLYSFTGTLQSVSTNSAFIFTALATLLFIGSQELYKVKYE